MNIGIRLHDTAGSTLEERLRNAHEQGFRCVHLALSKTLPNFSMEAAPTLMTDALAQKVTDLLEQYHMTCAVLGCYLNLATPRSSELAVTTACYKAHLRFAKAMGATVVGTETGAPNTGYKTCPECFTQEALELFISRLRPLVRYAEEIGTTIAIEPVCRHIVSTPERAKQVLDAIPSPNLQIILDPVNLLNMANHHRMPELFAQSVALFGDRIRVLHMKDYLPVEGATDVKSLACGLGAMDFAPMIAFAKAHPGIPMTLEDTVPTNAVAARECLERYA